MIERACQILLTLGCFLTVGSLLMVVATQPDTAERVVSIFSLILGVVAVSIAVVAVRITIHRRDGSGPLLSPYNNTRRSSK